VEKKQQGITDLRGVLPPDLQHELVQVITWQRLQFMGSLQLLEVRIILPELVDKYVRGLLGGDPEKIFRQHPSIEHVLWAWQRCEGTFTAVYLMRFTAGDAARFHGWVANVVQTYAESFPEQLDIYIRILLRKGRLLDQRVRIRDEQDYEIENKNLGKPLRLRRPNEAWSHAKITVQDVIELFQNQQHNVLWTPPPQ
jgi:hypothetical protein